MKRSNLLIVFLLSATSLLGLAQTRPFRATDRQVEQLLARLDTTTTVFRQNLDRALERSRWNNSRETEVNNYVSDFDQATAQLRDRFSNRQAVVADVEQVLNRGWAIDNFMRNNSQVNSAQQSWRSVRTNLQTLARYYNVPWNWENRAWTPATPGGASGLINQLTGTYSYDAARSENPNYALDRAVRGLGREEAERVRNALWQRIEAPAQLAIEQNGRSFSIASSNAPSVTLQANNRSVTERRGAGRTVRTTAALRGNILTISSLGERGSDFQVVIEPFENGRSLRVTRKFYADRLAQSVVTQSVYTRTSNVAELNLYNGNIANNPANNPRDTTWDNRRQRDFIIPDGTRLTAVLNNNLATKNAQSGERFTLTIRTPSRYDGAEIEGNLVDAERSGRITGRAELSMDFRSIRLRNGRSYDFAGYIESVRTPDGENLKVDNEGSVKDDDSQTERTVLRSGIGAALGAIIGGITGGGKGAAIGAAIGAGAGAGSVIVQGRDDITLEPGTEFTIRVSAPRTISAR